MRNNEEELSLDKELSKLKIIKERIKTGEGSVDVYIESLLYFIRCFCEHIEHKNTPEYVESFLSYIELIDDKESMFIFMQEKDIGQKLHLFYKGYSEYLEKIGRVNDAIIVLKRGVELEVDSYGILNETLNNLKSRFSNIRPTEIKGYDEFLIMNDLCFEEQRAKKYMQSPKMSNKRDELLEDNKDKKKTKLFDSPDENLKPVNNRSSKDIDELIEENKDIFFLTEECYLNKNDKVTKENESGRNMLDSDRNGIYDLKKHKSRRDSNQDFLSSDIPSDGCLPTFSLASGVTDEEHTEIDIYKDSTMDTREVKGHPLSVLKERDETPPISLEEALDIQISSSFIKDFVVKDEYLIDAKTEHLDIIDSNSNCNDKITKKEFTIVNSNETTLSIDGNAFLVKETYKNTENVYLYKALGLDIVNDKNEPVKYFIKIKRESLAGEYHCLSVLSSLNIAPRVYKMVKYKDVDCLITECDEYIELPKVISLLKNKRDRESGVLSLFISLRLLQAVRKLHLSRVFHGDIKCKNILFIFGDLKKEIEHFSSNEKSWNSYAINLCGMSRSVHLDLIDFEIDGECTGILCKGTRHSICYEIDLHSLVDVILSVLFPDKNRDYLNIDDLKSLIEKTENKEHIEFKKIWRSILVDLSNNHRSKEECLASIERCIKSLENALTEYDKNGGMDKLKVVLKRLYLDCGFYN
eukprot:GHVP01029853.1.p1 GENE.GHVP01029853.1~~GHVP01029853.1.p1  ORF type:complete len:695 (-),score=106.35 GHVP01029853.1:3021-5105(-)